MSRSELDPSSLQEHAPEHGRLRKHSWFGVGALSGVLVMGGVALSPIVGQLFAQQPSSSRDAPREQPSDGRPSNRDRPGQTGPREYPRSSDEERAGWLEEGRAGDRRPAVGRPSDAAGQPGSPYDAQPRSDVLFESRAPNSIPYYMPGGGSPSGPNVYNGRVRR